MTRNRSKSAFAASALTMVLGALMLVTTGLPAAADEAPIGLGAATSYAVLAGSTVTNTGPSLITGDVGVSPGSAVTGFPPGLVNGVVRVAEEAQQAKTDLVAAYGDASGRGPAASVAVELGGTTLLPGVYVNDTLQITGTLTLDAQGDPDAVFVLQSNETLVTATDSAVSLIGEANPCNVYWLVKSSATLGVRSDFTGTVLAQESITATTGATIQGRLLTQTGAVTLDTNVITRPDCTQLPAGPTTTAAPTTAPTTDVPTTDVPTTDVPTTDVPTTDVPTTDVPTTASQTPATPTPTATVGTTGSSVTTQPPSMTATGGPDGSPPDAVAGPSGPGGPGTPGGPGGPGGPSTPNRPGQPSTPESVVSTTTVDRSPPTAESPPLVATGMDGSRAAVGSMLLLLGAGMLLASRRRATALAEVSVDRAGHRG